MVQIVPLTSSGSRRVTVNFRDGVGAYTFLTAWNPATRTWHADIFDEREVAIIHGLTLVPGLDILRAYPEAKRRLGQLRVTTDNRGPNTLGGEADLVQLTDAEGPSVDADFIPLLLVALGDVT